MITVEPIELPNDQWLYSAITTGIKECLTAPILTTLPFSTTWEKRVEMLVKNFSREDCPAIPLIINIHFTQMLLPKDEILISILQIPNGESIKVEVVLNKLIHHGK